MRAKRLSNHCGEPDRYVGSSAFIAAITADSFGRKCSWGI